MPERARVEIAATVVLPKTALDALLRNIRATGFALVGPQVAADGMAAVAAAVRQVLSASDAVHISLDIDCLDPAFAPGTGIPDAGGLSSREVITLIQSLRGLPLAGLDVVEVSPPLDPSEATIFAALKFIMEFMGLAARGRTDTNIER